MTGGKPNTAAVFWSQVQKCGPLECWNWIGGKDKIGYGKLRWRTPEHPRSGNKQLAHRVAYALTFPEWKWNQCVLHSCDNPPCVNPAHLFAGSRADNNADMMTKGRHGTPRGEKHPKAKLTAEIVLAICADPLPPRRAAKKYGAVHSMISDIRTGRRWGSVTGRHWKDRQGRAEEGRQDQVRD